MKKSGSAGCPSRDFPRRSAAGASRQVPEICAQTASADRLQDIRTTRLRNEATREIIIEMETSGNDA
jgi:hypothetical protein